MSDLTNIIKGELLNRGAELVGFGDLSKLPSDVRHNLPVGICVAVKYPNEIIQGIAELPTKEYSEWYDKLNEQLDMLVTFGAELLQSRDYSAIAMTRKQVGGYDHENTTVLPHKTVATRAGIGWIGKSALLVNEQLGSKIRISSILTDAPLKTAMPINRSKCGACKICVRACPAEAVSDKLWEPGIYRDEFFDSFKCRDTAKEHSLQGFGKEHTICGKCIEVCPYSRRTFSK